jgi:Mlc titration factor MtfA (ptsG expression regulator)
MEVAGLLLMLGLAVYILYLRPRMKKKIKKEFPAPWEDILEEKVRFYQSLDPAKKKTFRDKILRFISNVKITGVDTELTDEDRVLVASSAVIPIFAFPDWEYKNLNEVLLYPNSFSHDYETEGENRNVAGMVGWGPMHRTMILSRRSLHQGFENEHIKSNVGIHEFVHLIDKLDGATDGVPEVLLERQYSIPWMKMIYNEIQEIKDKKSNINPYGATNEAEFFSVASEYFFTQPEMLKKKEPDLYELLEKIFRQDPASR